MKKKDFVIKWENILSPKEMEKEFGPFYLQIEVRDREVYMCSDYFVKEALKIEEPNVNQLVREIERIFLSLNRDVRFIKDKRCYRTDYPISISRTY